MNLDTGEWNRLRWQSHQGLLELDLALEHFLDRHRDELQGERPAPFLNLLNYTDNDTCGILSVRAPNIAKRDSPPSCDGCATAEVVSVFDVQPKAKAMMMEPIDSSGSSTAMAHA